MAGKRVCKAGIAASVALAAMVLTALAPRKVATPTPEARVRELLAGAMPAYDVVDVEATFYVGRVAIQEHLMRARLALRLDPSAALATGERPDRIEVHFGVLYRDGSVETGSHTLSRDPEPDATARTRVIDLALRLGQVERAAVVVVESVRGARGEAVSWPVMADLGPESVAPVAPEREERTELPAIRLLLPPDAVLVGRRTIGALVGRPGISRVRFLVDGETIGEDERSPWEASFRFDRTGLRHRVEAIGLGADGREVARDFARVNAPGDEPWVRIFPPVVSGAGRVVRVRFGASPERRLSRLDLFLGDRLLASLRVPPYEAELPPAGPASSFLRAVVHFDDGAVVEDVEPLRGTEFGESIEVSLVELFPRIVDDQGNPARIDPADLLLVDDGVERPVDRIVFADELPLLLGIAVDNSGSMEPQIARLRQDLATVLRSLEPGRDRAFLTRFAARSIVAQAPTSDPAMLAGALEGLAVGGQTALYDGIVHALIQFDRKSLRRALVVLTDGFATQGRFDGPRTLPVARRLGVPVYWVVPSVHGWTYEGSPERISLLHLVRGTGGELVGVERPEDLAPRLTEILDDLRAQALVAFRPGSERSGRRHWHPVELRSKRPDVHIEGELGYFAGGE